MKPIKKIFAEWIKDINIRIFGKELVEIEVNGKRALNYFYIERRKVFFPTRKEISKVLKKEIESRTKRELTPLTFNNVSYLNYYE